MAFDLFANGFDRRVRTQKSVRQCLVLSKQTQQYMFGLDERAAELASLVAREEYDSSGFLGITFKHATSAPAVYKKSFYY